METRGGGEYLAAERKSLPHCEKEKICYTSDMKHHFESIKKGFTLAEVLITSGVIGVVAALTLPSVISSYKEKQIVTSLKRANSVLNNAFKLAVDEYGTADTWQLDTWSNEGSDRLLDKMLPYLNYVKVCRAGKGKGCIPTGGYGYVFDKDAGGNLSNPETPTARVILNDGMIFNFSSSKADCSAYDYYCGIIDVDVNGFKKPNLYGYDVFMFWVAKDKIVPRGDAMAKAPITFRGNCGNQFQGTSCAAWVIYNENMDYLRCNDLDWNGKHRCK